MATKSLGRLTLDLVANTSGFVEGMTSAERASDKAQKKLESDRKKLAKDAKLWGVAVSTAAAAATAALVKSSIDASTAIHGLAGNANTTTDEFQRWSAAAEVVGVSQEKLSRIVAQFERRVGNFLQTGGGPLKNLFENLAPQIGITAEELRNLSGPQAMQRVVSAMEAAGIEGKELDTWFKQMADGSKDLQPLLADNGKALNELADYADRTGKIMSSETLEAGLRLGAVMEAGKVASQGFKNQIASQLLPTLSGLTDEFFNVAESGEQAKNIGEGIDVAFKSVLVVVTGVATAFKVAGDRLGSIAASVALLARGEFKAAFDVQKESVINTADAFKSAFETMGTIWAAGTEDAKKSGDSIVDTIVRVRSAMESLPIPDEESSPIATILPNHDKLQARLDAFEQALLTERELVQQDFEENNAMLVEALQEKLLTTEEYNELIALNHADHEANLTRITKMENQARLEAAQGMLGNLSTLMNSESRKAFELGKAAAIANTVINTAQSAMGAYSAMSSIPYVGPVLGAAAAAAAVAAGVVQIQNIRKQKFGSGSSGVSATQAVNNAAEPVASQQQQSKTVYLSGIDENSFVRAGSLVEMVNQELINGGQLVF